MTDKYLSDLQKLTKMCSAKKKAKHPIYDFIGVAIRFERKSKGLRQEELADLVGLNRTSIVNIEAGNQQLPIHRLLAIADALEIDFIKLLPTKDSNLEASALEQQVLSLNNGEKILELLRGEHD